MVEDGSSQLKSVTYTTSGEAKVVWKDQTTTATYSESLTYPDDFKGGGGKKPSSGKGFSDFQLVSPDFLAHGDYSEFLPSTEPASRKNVAGDPIDSPIPAADTLLGNAYPLANPVVAEHNGTRVIVYVHYDPARPAGQSTRLFYTIDSGGGFSVPAPLHSEARADFNPQLAFLPDGRLLVAFETSRLNQIALTAQERVSGLEVAWCLYDPNTSSWSAPALLSDNLYLDHAPRLAASAQGPMLVWQSNADNLLIPSVTSPVQVHAVRWEGSDFSAPTLLPAAVQPDGESDLAYDGTEAVFAWINDEDGDAATNDDTELYWCEFDGTAWSAPNRGTDDSVPDQRPRVFCLGNDEFELLWTKGVDLVRMSDFTSLVHQVVRSSSPLAPPPQFDVACDNQGRIALMWTTFAEGQVDLRYAVRERFTQDWSNELLLTHDSGAEKSPSFALSGNGTLVAAFLREEADTTQHDLLWLDRELGVDLTIGPVAVEPRDSDQFQIRAEFRNLGDLGANNVTVDFHLGDPGAGGTFLGSQNIFLSAGSVCETYFLTTDLPAGADGTIFVRIDPADTIAELDEANNSATIALNPVDLVAEDLVWERSPDGSVLSLTGTVFNKGRTTQQNIPIKVTGEQGELLVATIASLPAGARATVPGSLSTADAFPTADNTFTLKVDPDQVLNEPNRTDNDYRLALTLREPDSLTPDTDGDEMVDSWELANFGTLDRDGLGDFDGDGNLDLFEALQLTDPTDANSLFEFSVEPDPAFSGGVLISFPTVGGLNYRIQRSSDLHVWEDYSLHAGTGAVLVVPVVGIPNPGTRSSHLNSFRIQAESN